MEFECEDAVASLVQVVIETSYLSSIASLGILEVESHHVPGDIGRQLVHNDARCDHHPFYAQMLAVYPVVGACCSDGIEVWYNTGRDKNETGK